jgi:ATP-dependent Clp protease ATP-binding subunit ClpC
MALHTFAAGYSAGDVDSRGEAMVADRPINLGSSRSQDARASVKLRSNRISITISILGLLSFLGGLALFILENTLAYAVLAPSVIVLMLKVWQKGELDTLAERTNEGSVDGLLAPQLLAGLKSAAPSAFDVWQSAQDTEERWFLENRFMLPSIVFEQLLNKEPDSAGQVWQYAEELRKKYSTNGYTPAVVIIALLKTIPNIKEGLQAGRMELEDLEQAIGWIEDINTKRRLAGEKKSFGGLARDWAYGYTPTLRYLGQNISEEIQYNGFFVDTKVHQSLVEQMIKSMGSGTQSMTLVGEIGVGKTTCVYAFAKRILEDSSLPENIRYNQVVSLDAPTLVAHASEPGELERLILKILEEARRAKNMILFFDDAQVFFGQGTATVDLSNILIPALESGTNRLIFAVTPKEWQHIGSTNSALASKFQPLQVPPANEAETLSILRNEILFVEYQKNVLYTHQALKEAFRLGSRYVDNQAMPGAALTVLKLAAPVAKDGYVTAEVVQQSIESSTGVKIQHASGDETGVLLNMEDELHKYVINQKQAVSVIANALRRSRSGVGNPERPVGTFLFLGPTGVGKTELSKALARVYFGDEKSMIRVDMNQFVSPDDVNRLITPMLGEQLGFLGQVRRRPFSVILLDEIEKAHRNVVNLLLQTLDEGVMKDSDNKPVSFKDAIIIATSNAGADEIRRLIDEGKDVTKLQEDLVNTVIERNIFAPEFVNRFDEVVVFRPLNQEELVRVIDLIITGINKTLDSQKVHVELSEPAKKWLVEKGYDAKLGARPMRRVVQRYVENILAKRLLQQEAASGSKIKLDVKDFEEISEE